MFLLFPTDRTHLRHRKRSLSTAGRKRVILKISRARYVIPFPPETDHLRKSPLFPPSFHPLGDPTQFGRRVLTPVSRLSTVSQSSHDALLVPSIPEHPQPPTITQNHTTTTPRRSIVDSLSFTTSHLGSYLLLTVHRPNLITSSRNPPDSKSIQLACPSQRIIIDFRLLLFDIGCLALLPSTPHEASPDGSLWPRHDPPT